MIKKAKNSNLQRRKIPLKGKLKRVPFLIYIPKGKSWGKAGEVGRAVWVEEADYLRRMSIVYSRGTRLGEEDGLSILGRLIKGGLGTGGSLGRPDGRRKITWWQGEFQEKMTKVT